MAPTFYLILMACLIGHLQPVTAVDQQLKLMDCRQSSTHTPCERAIDGNVNQDWSGGSCSHTQMEAAPWWQANTPRLAHIKEVKIYNRLCGPACSSYLNNIVIKVDGVECASYHTDTFFSVQSFACNRVGQVVEIASRKPTYVMLCEVQVIGSYESLGHRGTPLPLSDCRQSSTHTDCARAIDGNTYQHWSGNSCSHTQHENNPWWQANTNQPAHIQQVRIYARLCGPVCSRYLSNILVKVDGHVCAKYHTAVGYISVHTFECNRVGQVVEVQGVGGTYLMLCELQVFGEYASLAHKGSPLPLFDCRQSSTHTDCSRAIDGKTFQHWSGNSCSHTQRENDPWWQANTKQLAHIQQVRIYARLCGPVCSRYLSNILVKVDGIVCARYHSDEYISVHTFECNRVGQVVEVQGVGSTYLMLCELQVFGEYASLAHKSDALPLVDCRQSSTHTDCARAIDGNTFQHWSGNTCSHTQRENNPWWQANTKQPANIQQVRIFARLCGPVCSRYLSNIRVKVDGHECSKYHSTGYISTITFDCNRVGQVVEIQGVGNTYLMLCELQVFGSYVPLPHKGELLKLHDCRQSSTHTDCARAIDGNSFQHWNGNSCSHTQRENNPWWQANTNQLAHIEQVRIYARLCGPVCSMYLSNILVKVDGHVCANYHDTIGYISVRTFECNRVGQVVEVQGVGSTYLMLCELQVFGRYASLSHVGDPLPLSDCRQSSTHTDCSRAIDGNTFQHWSGNTCSHTQLEDNPWFQANTKQLAHIQQVRIFARLCGPVCSRYLSNILVKVDGHVCAKYHSDEYISTITFECNRVGQVVEVRGVGKTYLMLCELQVFGKYASLAHKGDPLPLSQCRQSSTHTDCARAIDGNTFQHWNGNSCSHTQSENNPWWQANTNQLAHIEQVRIYARLCGPVCSRYLSNILVKVDGHVCANYHDTIGYISVRTFECNRVGQVVEVQGVGSTYLMLCELQVFGKYASLAHKGEPLPLFDCRQSSTHTECQRAIDGNTFQHWSGNTCSHTQLEDNPWWQANTNQLAHIQQVRIYARLCGPVCSRYLSNIRVKVDGHECASYHSAGYISTQTFECNQVGQVVEIQGVGKTYLMLCELQVFGSPIPLSHKGELLKLKDCSQSSTHTTCNRAIDGNVNQHWPGNSCSHTQLESLPWWQASTEKPAFIMQVRIYARLCGPVCSRYLKHLQITVDGFACAKQNLTDSRYISTHTFDCKRYGSRVRIEAQASTYLMLCEVQVFGRIGPKKDDEEESEAKATCKTPEQPPCIDKHDLSKHKVGTTWVTKVPADAFCYHYTCTGKITDGIPVLTDCMDASNNCVTPGAPPAGTKFACRPNENGNTDCLCTRRLNSTSVDFS